MALRKDYSLTKDIDFDDEDVAAGGREYDTVIIPGRSYKKALSNFLRVYEGVCGEDDKIGRIYSAVADYCAMEITDPDYTYSGELLLLKNLYMLVENYSADLENSNYNLGLKIDRWLASVNSKTMTPQQRKQDIQFVGQVELTLNKRVFLHELKTYINSLMNGLMPESNFPFEDPDCKSPSSALNLPPMVHIPQEADIDAGELSSEALMQVLFNIVVQDSYVISKMFHDYDNGDVCVRLWKNDNGEYVPCYFSVGKADVYLSKIVYQSQKSMWPGLIEAAVKQLGCGNDKLTLAEAILGPEYVNYDEAYISGPNESPVVNYSEDFNNLVQAYVKCVFNIYEVMLLTNSLVIADEIPYVKLMFGVKQLLYALSSCLCLSFDIAADTVRMVKQLMADYRKSVEESSRLADPIVKKRLSVCRTLDDVLFLLENDGEYHDDPRKYFERFLAEYIAKSLLTSLKKELTDEAVAAKTSDVLADKAFKKKTAKMNIHVLKYSTPKTAESVLAEMEGRKS